MQLKPRVVDLFAGEGGAGQGYAQAGFQVVGVDLGNFAKRYPAGPFLRMNVLDLDVRYLQQFDLIHASPPCQFGTELNSDRSRHVNLIPATRKLLQASGVPYVIENVRAVRPHLIDPISLFGTMFDLHMVTSTGQRFDLSRERLFETSWGLEQPPTARGDLWPIANVFGGHLRCRSAGYRTGNGTGRTRDFVGEDKPALARQLMGMDWNVTMQGMSEAVPPSYTKWIGQQFLAQRERIAA